jgi:DeoR/GlpR family transcriptional regulator of sugar metabolism
VAHALLDHNDLRIVTNNLNVANTLMVKEDSAHYPGRRRAAQPGRRDYR